MRYIVPQVATELFHGIQVESIHSLTSLTFVMKF